MSPEKRARRLQKIALRAARRAQEHRGGKPLTREELLALPVSPFALLWPFLMALGIFIAAMSILFSGGAGSIYGAAAGLLAGAALCYGGYRLRPRPLQTHLESHDSFVAEAIIGAILWALSPLK